MKLTVFIVPVVICVVFVCALLRKVNIFEEFSIGAKEGFKTVEILLPTLILMLTVIGMFRASGALDVLTSIVSKPMSALGIPREVLPLMILKPFSGGGSFAILEDIFKNYGVDSFVGRVASVIAGSTETTFYTIAVYFGSVGITKTRHTIFCALMADFTGFALSVLLVNLFFCN